MLLLLLAFLRWSFLCCISIWHCQIFGLYEVTMTIHLFESFEIFWSLVSLWKKVNIIKNSKGNQNWVIIKITILFPLTLFTRKRPWKGKLFQRNSLLFLHQSLLLEITFEDVSWLIFITLSHTQHKLYKLLSVAAQQVCLFLKIMPNIQSWWTPVSNSVSRANNSTFDVLLALRSGYLEIVSDLPTNKGNTLRILLIK